ncbi:MAG: fumarylacetoacetase [Balneolaceae bacterium]
MTKLTSWLDIPADSDFSIYNLPFGIFSTSAKRPRVGIAIGDWVVDVAVAAENGLFSKFQFDKSVFESKTLNDFISLGKPITNEVRLIVQNALCDEDSLLQSADSVLEERDSVKMHLPVQVGDYTDFYSSLEHATNVGKMFRDAENALLPNWKHLPVGYHGRASSIVESGVDIHRPKGQIKPDDTAPILSPTKKLDFELEIGFVVGKETRMGDSISTENANEFIFGLVLFNDWSARDIQKWEYVPLGPFLGKSFASSISPWIVTMEALEPFRVAGPLQYPPVRPYLKCEGAKNYDIQLEVAIQPEKSEQPTTVTQTNFKHMYWNMHQQLAHHTINGCNVRVGDVMASGTVSGSNPGSYGSMLELSWNGTDLVKLANDKKRTFLHDHDTVIMKGFSLKDDVRVGFGELKSKILPAV